MSASGHGVGSYETVIGLEVHVQLGLRTKLFSATEYAFGGKPNTRVSVIDLGLPGVLPRLNKAALRVAIRAALALEGEIQRNTRFDRKNYFYPDLPKGYQISQYEHPYCTGGRVPLTDGRYSQLERIHLEEDAGKNIHAEGGSLVDLNRAGSALVEIVGKPDLGSPTDAHTFLQNLKQILQYAGVSECDMEKGSLRCDANISVRPKDSTELGTKVEIKNLNSFKMVQRALEYEARRQAAVLGNGGTIEQETRHWNDERGETATMRTKESAQDYRYFPEPDLPPVEVPQALVDAVRAEMPELPAARKQRFAQDYALPEYDVDVLLADREVADYFELVAKATGDAKAASNWMMTEVMRVMNETQVAIADFPIDAPRLAGLIAAQQQGTVNRNAARRVFQHMLEHADDAATAIRKLGLQQISDAAELSAIVQQVIDQNPQPVADYRGGKEKALHALKGLVMRETRGRSNPQTVEELLLKLIQGA
ncbi:MAG: Asp-tRNA(Asn)/Glu-tRNA(Gln) amidotransferase subunit GatB [Planctomycetota bacterium]